MLNPFTPGTTVSLAVTTSTGSVALPSTHGIQVRVASVASNSLAFIRFGSATVEAAVTDVPILPGTVEVFSVPPGTVYMAGITATSTATLYVTSGDGQ